MTLSSLQKFKSHVFTEHQQWKVKYLVLLASSWERSFTVVSGNDLIEVLREDGASRVGPATLCGLNEYSCRDKLECISKDQICNGVEDCIDGSDEDNCADVSCRPGLFQCKESKKCIPAGFKCDSTPDCGFRAGFLLDLSDEEDEECITANPCAKNWIKCKDGFTCIPIANLCDQISDCPDGSDETDQFCGNATICMEALHCKYGCKPSEKGPICYCAAGKEYNGSECVASNKCLLDDTCDHICHSNSNATPTCECAKGFDLINGNECKAKDVPRGSIPLLLYHDLHGISCLHLNGSIHENFTYYAADPSTVIPGVTFDHLNRTICWINHKQKGVGNSTFRCAETNNLGRYWEKPQPYLYSLQDVYEVVCDWVTWNFYFMDSGLEIIYMCNNDLEICRTVVDSDISKPRAIALDGNRGLIFFTVWGRSGAKLEKANMDGTNRRNLVSTKIVYPEGLTLDLPRAEIFWVDRFLDAVERINYNGGNRRTMYRGIQHLRQISVFENTLYILTSKELLTLHKFNPSGKNYSTLLANLTTPLGIQVYHRQNQPTMLQAISPGCMDLFLPSNDQSDGKCICREGFSLETDQRTCKRNPSEQLLLYAKSRPGGIRSFSLTTNMSDATIPIIDTVVNSAFDYDATTSKIYYTDAKKFRIKSKGIFDTASAVFLDNGISHSEGIAVDWTGRNLYWTDQNLKVIYVTNLDHPEYRKLLIDTGLEIVKSIVVHPKAGLIFFSCWSETIEGKNGWIGKAWMNGERRSRAVDGLIWPFGLSLDQGNGYLYWVDVSDLKIERLHIGTGKTEMVYQLSQQERYVPVGMSFFKNSLYVSMSGNAFRETQYTGSSTGHILCLEIGNGTTKLHPHVVSTIDSAAQIKVYDASLQNDTNACSGNNCPELCFGIPEAPFSACECRDGYKTSSDGKACEKISNYRHPKACNASEFQCTNFPKCIPFSFVCNSVDDCGDSSDEESSEDGPCSYEPGLCGLNYFHCGEGKCIPKSLLCNGAEDCEDASDEQHKYCGNTTVACPDSEFQCEISKRCIPLSWTCDGVVDCSVNGRDDKSDEHESCLHPECTPLQFECDTKFCIPLENVCNGIQDCPGTDMADERDCETHCNLTNKYYCAADSKCLDPSQICDQLCQCSDASDEFNCAGRPPHCVNLNNIPLDQCYLGSWFDSYVTKEECRNITCTHNTWRCVNSGECLPHAFRCDNIADCTDGSDELRCPSKSPRCEFPSRLCDKNKVCVGVTKLCNGIKDCIDGSDEGAKDASLCHENQCVTNTSHCSDSCQNSPEGHVCYCPQGKHLTTNKSSCVEDHPCDQFGTCSQICRRIGSRHHCLCLPGYDLKEDGFTCVSSNSDIPYLVFSNRHELRGINLRNLQFNALISNLRNSIALDFYYDIKTNSSIVFWTDVVDDRIYRGNLITGSLINIEVVIQTGLATAEGLAVDWIGENLYWIESNLDQIEVAKLNGSFRKTLTSGQMVSPRSIALDPSQGILFWTDWDSDAPRIESASMSGDGRKVVVRVGDMSWPNGLTLDLVNKRVFYCDARLDSIHSIKYDGTDFQTVLDEHEALSHPFAITMFESSIYYSDWRSNSIIKANKFNGSDVTTIHRTYTQPFDVKVIHPSRQPRNGIVNPCESNHVKCSHLCLLSFNLTSKCGCPHLMTLGPDGSTCINYEKMLIFSRLNEIRAVYLNKPYFYSAPPLSLNLIVNPGNLHFVAKNKEIFFLDAQSGETKRANVSNPTVSTLMDAASGKPLAMSVDWMSNLIFVALQSPVRTLISVTDLSGQYFTTIIHGKSDLKGINSIAVNPYKGQIYFPDGTAKGTYTIQSAQMDGQKRAVLCNNRDNFLLEKPISVSYDYGSDRVYWLNYNENREVQYYDFATKQVRTISFGEVKANVITVYDSFVYFAAEKQDAIMKGDKTIGGPFVFVRNDTENVHSIVIYDPDEQRGGANPCSLNKGGCEHICLPITASKKVCKCALGYKSDLTNGSKCSSLENVLLYADTSGIRGLSPDPDSQDDHLIPIPLVSFATDIDVDEKNSYLYWLDNDKGRISRIRRDGTGREVVLSSLDAVLGLAIDWCAGNMYWANPKDPMIEIAHLNGSSRYVLITAGLDKPMSLAVDPTKGFLFWSDIAKGQIERAQLDGTDRKVIVSSEGLRATDITLDIENARIYWSDSIADKIESSTYDGSDRKIVYSGLQESHIHSPIIGNGTLFWIDMGQYSGSIMAAPLNTLSPVRPIRKNLGVTIKDLSLFSKGKQSGTNACSKNNGGCGDLCLFNGTHPVCKCAHGKVGANGKTCENYDAFIAYSRVQSIETIHVQQEITPNSPYPPIQSAEFIRNVIGLAFDISQQRLFYSDVQLGTINSVFFNGTNFTVVAEKQGSVEGLYFEATHQDLYWTCSNDASINRLNPYSGGTRFRPRVEQVLKLGTNDRPRGIACDPCKSLVFWTNWDANRPSIQRSYMSGAKMESIIDTNIRMPNGLALDQPNSHLYFIDARLDKIERVNYDGSNRRVIGRDKPKHAFAIAVHGDYLYWSDWVLFSILRANKFNGDDVIVLRKDIPKPMGIVAVSNQTFKCVTNSCEIENGGCAERCTVAANGKVICSCYENRTLIDEGRCVVDRGNKGFVYNPQSSFICGSGEAIPYVLSCNGIKHCPDGSDEDDLYCATRSCRDGFFTCPSRRCINNSDVCNGVNDCGGMEDERNCNCTELQFRCGDGRCIYKAFLLCDGHEDCNDGSDERNCTVIHTIDSNGDKKLDCPPNAVRCKDSNGCYLSTWKCDHDKDCSDGSDEENCVFNCRPGQFRCNTSQECINELFYCDGSPDCLDNSDEINCENRTCDLHIQFQCPSSKICLPIQWVCDGDAECQAGEDEDAEHCANVTKSPAVPVCPSSQFQCSNGLCILNEYYCDRDDDCGSGEDEPATCHYNKCDNSSFVCGNGRCVSKTLVCNKVADCLDGSDEKNCRDENYCRGRDDFLCKNNICINETLVCNGEDDCGDFSDEVTCNINECEQPGTCQHRCIDKKIGYICECLPGFKPDPVTLQQCLDIDECAEHPCSQMCTNTFGSFSCSCSNGFLLREDHRTCKSMSSDPVKILFSNQYYVRMVDLNYQESIVAGNLTNAVALDYDFANSCMYYSDVVTTFGSTIKRICNIFGNQSTAPEVIFLEFQPAAVLHAGVPSLNNTLHHITLQSPDGLAVDWVAGNLYFCDKGTDTIEVSKLDGSFRKILLSEGLQEPRAIALDPFSAYCFYSDWGETPHIGRIGMDGSNFTILISQNLGWPNALTLSSETKELWWADAREDYIAVADLDGQNRRVVYSRVGNPTAKVHHIFSMSVFEDMLYYSDWELKSIERVHKYHGTNHSTLTKTIHRPMDVKVYHPQRQPQLEHNPCENNGGCPTLCLLRPGGGRVCACPENFVLSADGMDCEPNCTSSQFVCEKTKRCLPFWWKCDKQDDCGDLSDEGDDCPEFRCIPGQYQCSDGHTCLHPAQICDNRPDCPNGTEEQGCDTHTCFSTQYKCSGNSTHQAFCIPSYKVCDEKFDCPNHEDENNCLPQFCAPNQFKCNNSRCISAEWVCDEVGDCLNSEDEMQNCSTRTCLANQFRCSTGKCIPTGWICDGEMDCKEGEDELKCEGTETATCDPTYFKCDDNKCIPGRWKCDFDEDCRGGSDEANCVPRNCSESEFRCKDGRCIRGANRCNGEFNCGGFDRSDEENCNLTCSAEEFTCSNPRFCVSLAFKCDRENDCADGSDEANCPELTCLPDQFMCKSGSERCISKAFICDNEDDCIDGSDEFPELCARRPCDPGKFRCSNGTCISYTKVCDRNIDCSDGNDEFGLMCAGKYSCQAPGQFLCNNKLCINSSLTCDGEDDCGDNSDEKDCAQCPFATCSQICIKKPTHNTRQNYSCECAPGYRTVQSGSTSSCKALDEPPYMLIASENDLKRTDPFKPYDNETSHIFSSRDPSSKAKIESLDYIMDPNGGVQIFWSSLTRKAIQSMYQPKSSNSLSVSKPFRKKRATENIHIIIVGLEEPRGIAVCWITQRLYFIDSAQDTLSVSSLDGKNRIVLINTGMNEPHDIVVEPESGRMFWSDLAGRIEVALMDGTHRKIFVMSPCPAGLTIDYAANPKRIYWADIKSHSVESATLHGKDRRIVRRFIGAKPYHIEIFEDLLYITTYHSNRIFKMNKFGKGNHTDITQGLMNAADVLIIQSNKQKRGENPCNKISCNVPGICLRNSSISVRCVCPDSQPATSQSQSVFQCNATSSEVCGMDCKQGTCVLGPNGPSCLCNPLYEGLYCEKYRCSGYCFNKGLCYHSNDISSIQPGTTIPLLQCNCLPNFTGARCEIPYVSCRGKCENNGTCNESMNFCECPKGFGGQRCERCDGLECLNGGTCTRDKRGKPHCACFSGYSGSVCQTSKCDCNSRGKCKLVDGNATCHCNPGYAGNNCEFDLCLNFCKNGGTCLKKPSSIVCSCPLPFRGTKCDINPCDCLKCRPGDLDLSCATCSPGQIPPECLETAICPADFCRNGGTCSIRKNAPVCSCTSSWIGIHCEIPENPARNPCNNHCLHGGVCLLTSSSKKATCACLPEWTGSRCQTRNSCLKYCFNGGTCMLHPEPNMEPICDCPDAYTGARCQTAKLVSANNSEDGGVTWVLVLVFIVVAVAVASFSGCAAYFVMRRKQGRPFMHVRMDAGTVEIHNPMFLKDGGDELHGSEPSLPFDSDEVLLQGTNFANPLYHEPEQHGVSDEKKGLLQAAEDFSSGDHPLAEPTDRD